MTLEDDVADLIDKTVHRTGQPMKEVVNQALRRGLHRRESGGGERFSVDARPMGLRPGYDLASISTLTDRLDGPTHR